MVYLKRDGKIIKECETHEDAFAELCKRTKNPDAAMAWGGWSIEDDAGNMIDAGTAEGAARTARIDDEAILNRLFRWLTNRKDDGQSDD